MPTHRSLLTVSIISATVLSALWAPPFSMAQAQPTVVQEPQEPVKATKDIPTIVKEATPAVVAIVVSDAAGRPVGQGSGFVVSRDGRVVTNFHVIKGAGSMLIKFSNGAYFVVEGVLATDVERDIAILQAKGEGFSALPLGDADLVQVGEEVIAIGTPKGLEATVSNGIVSAVRKLTKDLSLIQTTAPISPGSSGGPLLDMRGKVIGITSLAFEPGQNLNFAVPVNYVKPLLDSASVKKLSAPPQDCRGEGLYVAAFRKSGHVTTSSPEVFHRAVDEVVLWLRSSGVCLVDDHDRPMIRTADYVSVVSLLNITGRFGAKYFLYVTVDRPVTKWIKVTLQCYDLAGQLLWQEEASEGGGLTSKNSIPKTMEKLKKKLQPRLGQPGLPLKATAPTQP